MLLCEVSGHLGVQSHRVQELCPQGHHVGGEPGQVLPDLLGYLVRMAQHLRRGKVAARAPAPRSRRRLLVMSPNSSGCGGGMSLSYALTSSTPSCQHPLWTFPNQATHCSGPPSRPPAP